MTDISAAFGKPFAQQVAAFRIRLGDLRATEGWKDVWQAEHDRAFMVAGAQKAELLADLAAAVDKAIAKGTTLEEFRADFEKAVADHAWHGWAGETTEKGRAWRTRVIYGTNLSTSYAAGQYAQLKKENWKYWIYRHGNSAEPREQHLGWDGLILPPDHPFWASHYPPNGWGCSCWVTGANSMASAIRRGGKPDLKLPNDWQKLDPKTGAPEGIDKGWAYAPGRSVARTIDAIAQKVATLPAPTGADLLADWPDRLFDAWSDLFGSFVDASLAQMPRNIVQVVGVIKPNWVREAAADGVLPASAEIAVRDIDVRHTFDLGKVGPLDLAWYRRLPMHLRKPDVVLLDRSDPKKPALMLLYSMGTGTNKLMVIVDYQVKKQGVFNLVRTGRVIAAADLSSMRGQIASADNPGGWYRVIEGELP